MNNEISKYRYSLHLPLLLAGLLLAGCTTDNAIRKGFIQLGADRLYHESAGRGLPVVLIGGGGVMDLRQWDELFDSLKSEYHVIRYDPRGTGRSAMPTEEYAESSDLRALLDELHVEKAVLVGLSSAGGTALEFALEYPDRVLGLVLAAPFVNGFQPSEELKQRMSVFVEASERGVDAFITAILKDQHFIPAPRNRAARVRAQMLLRDNFKSFSANPNLVRQLDPPIVERIRSIQVPTRILIGALDHEDLHRRVSFLCDEIAGAKLRVLEDSGHMSNLENPRAFGEEVMRFLNELEMSGRTR